MIGVAYHGFMRFKNIIDPVRGWTILVGLKESSPYRVEWWGGLPTNGGYPSSGIHGLSTQTPFGSAGADRPCELCGGLHSGVGIIDVDPLNRKPHSGRLASQDNAVRSCKQEGVVPNFKKMNRVDFCKLRKQDGEWGSVNLSSE